VCDNSLVPNTHESPLSPRGEVSGRSGSYIKTREGVGVVKKAGDRELKNSKLADGKTDNPESEGFYRWSAQVPATLEEVTEYFSATEVRNGKSVAINALVVKDENGDKITLDPEACIVEVVAQMIADGAKSNAYQKVLAKFKPAEDPKLAFEKIVRGFMSMGVSEEIATRKAQETLDENAAREAEAAAAEVKS